eukprot:TRINITY_DN15115_c0_g1_i1.p1 TRINITY_DN15115_c0_g1~~TRINITY_DN15115_c0_g1_i1.p1  ORF type:complete len:684 (+),score=118.04 TRINITY_DN15115_c0_g1_i1:100-2151(+)
MGCGVSKPETDQTPSKNPFPQQEPVTPVGIIPTTPAEPAAIAVSPVTGISTALPVDPPSSANLASAVNRSTPPKPLTPPEQQIVTATPPKLHMTPVEVLKLEEGVQPRTTTPPADRSEASDGSPQPQAASPPPLILKRSLSAQITAVAESVAATHSEVSREIAQRTSSVAPLTPRRSSFSSQSSPRSQPDTGKPGLVPKLSLGSALKQTARITAPVYVSDMEMDSDDLVWEAQHRLQSMLWNPEDAPVDKFVHGSTVLLGKHSYEIFDGKQLGRCTFDQGQLGVSAQSQARLTSDQESTSALMFLQTPPHMATFTVELCVQPLGTPNGKIGIVFLNESTWSWLAWTIDFTSPSSKYVSLSGGGPAVQAHPLFRTASAADSQKPQWLRITKSQHMFEFMSRTSDNELWQRAGSTSLFQEEFFCGDDSTPSNYRIGLVLMTEGAPAVYCVHRLLVLDDAHAVVRDASLSEEHGALERDILTSSARSQLSWFDPARIGTFKWTSEAVFLSSTGAAVLGPNNVNRAAMILIDPPADAHEFSLSVTLGCTTINDVQFTQTGLVMINEADWAWTVWGLQFGTVEENAAICVNSCIGANEKALVAGMQVPRDIGAISIRIERRFNEFEYSMRNIESEDESAWQLVGKDSTMGHFFTPGRYKIGIVLRNNVEGSPSPRSEFVLNDLTLATF